MTDTLKDLIKRLREPAGQFGKSAILCQEAADALERLSRSASPEPPAQPRPTGWPSETKSGEHGPFYHVTQNEAELCGCRKVPQPEDVARAIRVARAALSHKESEATQPEVKG